MFIISLFFILTLVVIQRVSAATVTYTYDNLNRITSVDYGNGNIEEYTYDEAGNRLTLTVTVNDSD
ncbi:MAG: RHS repeat protein [Nitrospinae bacterium]|nr:RHS repeat protein [Nitrospinota bacterium]